MCKVQVGQSQPGGGIGLCEGAGAVEGRGPLAYLAALPPQAVDSVVLAGGVEATAGREWVVAGAAVAAAEDAGVDVGRSAPHISQVGNSMRLEKVQVGQLQCVAVETERREDTREAEAKEEEEAAAVATVEERSPVPLIASL